jgi:hypothetical protein
VVVAENANTIGNQRCGNGLTLMSHQLTVLPGKREHLTLFDGQDRVLGDAMIAHQRIFRWKKFRSNRQNE